MPMSGGPLFMVMHVIRRCRDIWVLVVAEVAGSGAAVMMPSGKE
jgi:hypothetical protein